jgi:ABC-type nitrate/sulfonate/bicarbonate transport system substrate-binding protein
VAGTVALGDIVDNAEVLKVFTAEYAKAIDWLLANPEEAGEVAPEPWKLRVSPLPY